MKAERDTCDRRRVRRAAARSTTRVLALTLTLVLALEAAHADNMCESASGTGPVSDLSLSYVSEQPASLLVCGYANLAIKCGDHARAHRILDKCIAKGYVGSMIMKGMLLEDGRGQGVDLARAAALYRQAAASGEGHYATLGKLHYATALHLGRGVPEDQAQARRWFEQAAREGSADAEEFLRTGYHTGSRDVNGRGVGPAGDMVRGIGLVREEPAAPPRAAGPGERSVLVLLLGTCLLAGAWWQSSGTAQGLRPRCG